MAVKGVKRVDHIAIVVHNIEEALQFYQSTLGVFPSVVKDFPSEGVRIAFVPVGGADGAKIELLQPLDSTNGVAKFLAKHGEGQHHICLEVEDIDAALEQLQADGAPVLDAIPRLSADGRAVFIHPKGANGVLYELVQRNN